MKMLEEIEVRELVCRVSSDEEIATVHEWIWTMHAIDQSTLLHRLSLLM